MLLPEFLYPGNLLVLLSVLILALVLDYIYPYHSGLLLKIHPVHTSYVLALRLGKPYSSRTRGIVTWFIVTTIHLLVYGAILYFAWYINLYLWILIASYITKTSISIKLLIDIVKNVHKCALRGDWNCSRFWAQQIVRRNVYELDEEHVISASIESLAESLVDGFSSPLFYYVFLGPLGALLQRIANTLDGALGFKTSEYLYVGWFSAKMDTVLNYIPARITALLIVLLSPLINGNVRYSYRIWKEFCRKTESLNAGHPISAIAGALGVKLEKPQHYTIGFSKEKLNAVTIARALRISIAVTIVWISIAIVLLAFITFAASAYIDNLVHIFNTIKVICEQIASPRLL